MKVIERQGGTGDATGLLLWNRLPGTGLFITFLAPERCRMTRRLDTPPPPPSTKRPPDATTPPYTPGGVTAPEKDDAVSPAEKTAPPNSYPPKRKP